MGDFHLGNIAFREDVVKKYIAWVLEKSNRYVILMGDLIENTIPGHNPGNSLSHQNISPQQQIYEIARILEPIKERVLFYCGGNHEQRTSRNTTIDIVEVIANKLDIKDYAEYDGFVVINLGKAKYKLYINHGYGYSKYPQFQLRKAIYDNGLGGFIDVVAIGHIHQVFGHFFDVTESKGNKVYVIDKCLGIRTGCALGYDGYIKEKMYQPHTTGFPIVIFKYDKKRLQYYKGLPRYEG